MRPPICAICHNRFDPSEGGLLSFTLTTEERESNKVFDKKGYTGHPKGLEWFCPKHFPQAKSLTHLNLREALRILNTEN